MCLMGQNAWVQKYHWMYVFSSVTLKFSVVFVIFSFPYSLPDLEFADSQSSYLDFEIWNFQTNSNDNLLWKTITRFDGTSFREYIDKSHDIPRMLITAYL